MNLANKLTLTRIALTFVFMAFLFMQGLLFKVLALIIFVLASGTDFLDGYVAKKFNQVSDFGKFMDPIADKVLVLSAFLAFVEMKLVPAWIVVIIVFREFLITGLRLFALARGEVVAAVRAGKHKTVSQMVSIYIILLFIVLREAGTTVAGFWSDRAEYISREVIFYMMVVTALFTIISGVSYLMRNKRFFTNGSRQKG